MPHRSPRRTNARATATRPLAARPHFAIISRALFLPALLLPALFAANVARADNLDTVNLFASSAVMHDSNFFRLSDSANAAALIGSSDKSETYKVNTVGLRFNKAYSLQRFELEATLVDYRYNTYDYLDFTAKNYSAAWRWAFTPYLSGNLTSKRSESLNSFSDYSNYRQQNIRTQEDQRFDAALKLPGGFHLLAGISESTSTNSKIFVQEGDSKLTSSEAGLRYTFASGANIGYVARTGHGEYTNRPQPIAVGLFDNEFDQDEHELRIFWPITGKTSLDGRFARVSRTQEHYSARDYSGNVGNFNLNWNPTAKTRITAGWTRQLNAYQQLSSSYYVSDNYAITPTWQITSRTTLRGSYSYQTRDYRGAIAVTAANDRSDTQRTSLIALDWQPMNSVVVSTSLQSDQRSSNLSGFDYKTTIGMVSAQLTF